MLNRRDLLRTSAATALAPALAAAGLSGPALAETAPGATQPSIRQIAAAGFIYGLPLVMNYGVMFDNVLDPKSGQWKAPFNTINHEARLFTYRDTSVLTPNSDTLTSLAWLDLREGPLVVTLPPVDPKRYVCVQFVDGNTYNYGYAGSRTTGNGGGNYLVVGPRWFGRTPPGIDGVFRSSTFFSLVNFRTQLFDAGDLDNVKKVQEGYQLRPLSTFLGTGEAKPAQHFRYPAFSRDRLDQEFFAYLDFALRTAPARPDERWIRDQLKRIGVGPDRGFRVHEMPEQDQAEIIAGMKEGEARLAEAVAQAGAEVNGWRIGAPFGDDAFFHGDWMLRAVGTRLGIYGNDPAEALFPAARTDKDGQPLDGAKHRYTLTFPKDGLPPVNAFWSVTVYDGKTQLLSKNPIDRYLINSPMLPSLKTDPDGSLTLYIQKETPGADKEANWLPAPDGPISLVMRLYWPKTGAPSILPPGKGTWQPPGIVRVA